MKKVLIIFMFFVISVGLFFLPKVQAADSMGDIFSTANDWVTDGKGKANLAMNTVKLEGLSGQLYNILLALGTGTALIIGTILGIQFMTAGIDKRVQVKESIYPYLISCIVVFGSIGIWKVAVLLFRDI